MIPRSSKCMKATLAIRDLPSKKIGGGVWTAIAQMVAYLWPMTEPVERIIRDHGFPDLVEALSERLSGTDLTSLLLEVMRRRASSVDASEVMNRYESDRFVRPGPGFRALRRVEDAMVEAVGEHAGDEGLEWITLAPVVPLGTHSAMGFVDQNNLVATIRSSEVAADPTNALGLEAAVRRRVLQSGDSKSDSAVHLAGLQRVLRAQFFDNPNSSAHFTALGLVSAGRDVGSARFEREAASRHIAVYKRALNNLGINRIRVDLTSWNPDTNDLSFDGVEVNPAPDRTSGYYCDLAFKIYAELGAEMVEVGDGGATDWTQRLCNNNKERLVVSGLGLDRLASGLVPADLIGMTEAITEEAVREIDEPLEGGLSDPNRYLGAVNNPSVLFLCVHNAGRSQMAAGWLRHLAAGSIDVYSAGSEPAEEINPVAVAAMAELDIDISEAVPQIWTDDVVRAVDVVVTMGCGDVCPVYPGKRYLDWALNDPAGQGIEAVRPIRDEIEHRVRSLISELADL